MSTKKQDELLTVVLSRLRDDGSRITRAREEIVDVLIRSHEPLTISELVVQVTANEASVYRTVERLLELGVLEVIQYPENVTRYALVLEHHHHIVCTGCRYTAHLSCGSEAVAPVHPGFSEVTNHTITYYGLCTSCAKI